MSENLRSIGSGLCASCRRRVSLNPSGLIRMHRVFGRGSAACSGGWAPPAQDGGAPVPTLIVNDKEEQLRITLQLRGGRLLRCSIPLGVEEADRAEIFKVMEMATAALRTAWAPSGAAGAIAQPTERS